MEIFEIDNIACANFKKASSGTQKWDFRDDFQALVPENSSIKLHFVLPKITTLMVIKILFLQKVIMGLVDNVLQQILQDNLLLSWFTGLLSFRIPGQLVSCIRFLSARGRL